MSFALARKELREHGGVLVLTLLFEAAGLLAMLRVAAEEAGRFSALMGFAFLLGPLGALVAANRLLVREYAGRTQLFLEVLPIGRARVFWTKWGLGALWTLGTITAAWAVTLVHARRSEVIAWERAADVWLAVGSAALAMWSFAALAGMLGRHRYTAWLGALLAVGIAVSHGGMAMEELPVMRLLGPRTAMAQADTPLRALSEAWALAALLTAGAAALALLGAGAIASALAQRMTTRERVFVLVMWMVALFLIGLLDRDREKPPFALRDAVEVSASGMRVGVMPTADLAEPAAQALARTIAGDVESAVQYLGLPSAPPVFVLPQQGLDPTSIEHAALDATDGIVLRVAPDVVQHQLRAEVLHALLARHTHGRAAKEDRHVLLDGFTVWWSTRGDEAARELELLRAAAARVPVSASALVRWEETSEQLGLCLANAVAFVAVDTLVEQLGAERAQALFRALFSEPRDDVRVLFETSPARRLEAAGTTWSQLAAKTEARRARAQEAHASVLGELRALTGQVHAVRDARSGASIEVALAGADEYYVLYAQLGPWTRGHYAMPRLDVRGERATLPISPPRGARVLAAMETESSALRCPLRVHAARVEVP